MRNFLVISLLILPIFYCCESKNIASKKHEKNTAEIVKADCDYYGDDKSDTTFNVKNEEIRIILSSACIGDYSIYDTIFYEDTTITIYQDRVVNVRIITSDYDTTYLISKELIKDIYNDDNTFNNSVFTRPYLSGFDTSALRFQIHVFFCYPHNVEGDFGETIIFSVGIKGDVKFEAILEEEYDE